VINTFDRKAPAFLAWVWTGI